MNDTPPKTATAHTSSLTRLGSMVLVMLCLALGGATLYLRTQLQELRHDLGKRLSETDQFSRQTERMAQQAVETTRESRTRLDLLESRFTQSQNQQIELEALYQDLMRNHDEWILAEVEQLVIVANQQLELTGNVSSALAALEAADLRLQRIDKPLFSHLREAVKQDIDRLRALPYVDTNGIALRLDGLEHEVDHLPLASDARPTNLPVNQPPASGGIWNKISSKLMDELSNAVKIRRMDAPELPLLTPEQAYFLKENLKLRLMAARIDALARQETRYQNDLKDVSEWIDRYFDRSSVATLSFESGIHQLAATPVSLHIPDISATLAAVHAARGMHP